MNQNHKIQYNPQLRQWTKCEKQKRMKRNSQIDPTQYYEKNESKSQKSMHPSIRSVKEKRYSKMKRYKMKQKLEAQNWLPYELQKYRTFEPKIIKKK